MWSRLPDGVPLAINERAELEHRYGEWSRCGMRVLAIAQRTLPVRDAYARSDEDALEFAGFLVFSDRPKAGATEAVAALSSRGVSIKLITGDNQLVARHVAELVGFATTRLLTGVALEQ
jgi:Mg2+-importing ATPase